MEKKIARRIAKALSLIDEQGLILTCDDYKLDYFQLQHDFERETHKRAFERANREAFKAYAANRITERAAKGSPTQWKNRFRQEASEARHFADIYSHTISAMENRGIRGFIPVSADQVEVLAACL